MLLPSTIALTLLTASLSVAKQYSQESLDQFNVLRSLGSSGPFIQLAGFGIPTEAPDQCQIEQLFLFMRHGERFPTTGTGKQLQTVLSKLQKNANGTTITGPLAFLNDYEYFVPNKNYYEAESYAGDYSGLADAFNVGTKLRNKYDDLFDNQSVFPVFCSSQERVVRTAQSFARGFFNSNYSTLASIQVLSENASMGANSLTVASQCSNLNSSANQLIVDQFSDSYLLNEANRLNRLSPGLNITGDDVYNLLGYCLFELNVAGSSKMCDALSTEAYIGFEYSKDLGSYYQNGPGLPDVAIPLGGLYANATATLLKQGPDEVYPLYFSFSHDTDLMMYVSALGLLDNGEDLPTDRIDFFRSFKTSSICPMGGRLITERLRCFNSTTNETEIFVRSILNDAVTPLPNCQSGPGYSCPLDDYVQHVQDRISIANGTSYADYCGTSKSYPQSLSFYWNWNVTFENN